MLLGQEGAGHRPLPSAGKTYLRDCIAFDFAIGKTMLDKANICRKIAKRQIISSFFGPVEECCKQAGGNELHS